MFIVTDVHVPSMLRNIYTPMSSLYLPYHKALLLKAWVSFSTTGFWLIPLTMYQDYYRTY